MMKLKKISINMEGHSRYNRNADMFDYSTPISIKIYNSKFHSLPHFDRESQ